MTRKLFRLGRTTVSIHPATALVAAYLIAMGRQRLLLIATLSILLHEGAHALAAVLTGHPPEEMELTPLGAMLRVSDEARIPRLRRLIILLAGPLMTALLAALALILTREGILPRDLGRALFMNNLGILGVNLLPVLPLDGGRLLTLLLSFFLSTDTCRRAMRVLGWCIGIACVVGNVLLTNFTGGLNLSLASAGCFIIYAGSAASVTSAMAELRAFMDRKIRIERRGLADCRCIAVLPRTPLRQAILRLPERGYAELLLLAEGSLRPIARVTEDALIAAYLASPGEVCACLQPSDGKTHPST